MGRIWRHCSKNFKPISDAVRFVLCCHGYQVINYIDDFIGFGTPDVAAKSFQCLCDLLRHLGLTLREKKLVSPTTQAISLGINIDTISGTFSIPPEKLEQIIHTVKLWQTKMRCTKKELQSLLGQLLYVHNVSVLHVFSLIGCWNFCIRTMKKPS